MGAATPGIHLRWLPGVEFAIGDGNGVGTLFAVVPEVAGLTGG
jgi:hypothetical protein